MPIIQCVLTRESLDEAIAKVKEYRDRLDKADEAIVKRLTNDGAKQAQELVSYMNAVDTGELMSSIIGEANGKTGKITAGTDHAAFVEFGTGVVGLASQHPQPIAGWKYDKNGHGDAGWYYYGDDGKKHWTRGMPSRPYMYDTAQMMAQAVPDVVAEELQS